MQKTDSPAHPTAGSTYELLEPKTLDFYLHALSVLDSIGVRFAVGGAYALAYYAKIVRHTKDLDIFVKHDDAEKVIADFSRLGFRTAWTHPHWIAKAFSPDGEDFIDVIYGSGNGLTAVDEEWLDHCVQGEILGRSVQVCPAEEIVWSKCFIQERERFDGADVAHLLLARGEQLDWDRLLNRFRGHEGVLLAQVTLFRYSFPGERHRIPQRVVDELRRRADADNAPAGLCRGPFISYKQYLIDVNDRGYVDARLKPRGPLTAAEIDRWTKAPK